MDVDPAEQRQQLIEAMAQVMQSDGVSREEAVKAAADLVDEAARKEQDH